MRICIDASPAVHHRGGFGRYVQELVSALLAVETDNEYVAFYNRPTDAQVDAPLDCLAHLTTNLPAKPWRMSAMLAHATHIPQDRLLPGIDVFHATDNVLPRLSRVRSVFALHDLIFRFYPETHSPLNRCFLTLMMPRFLHAADAVIATSDCTRKDAVRLYGLDEAKVRVIWAAVSSSFHPRAPEDISVVRTKHGLPDSFILSVGTLEPRKNLTSLLEAYRALKNEGSDCKLVIVGKKGWLYEGFFVRLRELGLEQDVVFPGFVPDDDLPALYSAAHLLAFPSLYEGFGFPVLEAMACGVPVVTSNTSSLPEVAGEAALLVDPKSVEELAAAMRRLLDDTALRAEMRARGLKRASRFTWEETARRTAEVYREVR
jgi:glycosyltransferase involved in cell wall biosynthesis